MNIIRNLYVYIYIYISYYYGVSAGLHFEFGTMHNKIMSIPRFEYDVKKKYIVLKIATSESDDYFCYRSIIFYYVVKSSKITGQPRGPLLHTRRLLIIGTRYDYANNYIRDFSHPALETGFPGEEGFWLMIVSVIFRGQVIG